MLLQIQLLRQPAWIVLIRIKTVAEGSGKRLRDIKLLVSVITLARSQYFWKFCITCKEVYRCL